MRLLWLDLETTGLDPQRDRILEVALSEADLLDPFSARPIYHAVIHYVAEEGLDPFIVDMHTKNGLLAECSAAWKSTQLVELELLELVPFVADKDERTTLAGSSIHFDHGFLKALMPGLAQRLSHRHYDVSALKLFCQSMGMPRFPKAMAHRAQADIEESVAHAQACVAWLRDNLR